MQRKHGPNALQLDKQECGLLVPSRFPLKTSCTLLSTLTTWLQHFYLLNLYLINPSNWRVYYKIHNTSPTDLDFPRCSIWPFASEEHWWTNKSTSVTVSEKEFSPPIISSVIIIYSMNQQKQFLGSLALL